MHNCSTRARGLRSVSNLRLILTPKGNQGYPFIVDGFFRGATSDLPTLAPCSTPRKRLHLPRFRNLGERPRTKGLCSPSYRNRAEPPGRCKPTEHSQVNRGHQSTSAQVQQDMAPPTAARRDSTHLSFGAGAVAGAGADNMDVSNDSPGQESATAADSNGDKTEHAPKRIRLNLACNQCRKRKVRCDAETPKVSQISEEKRNLCILTLS